MIGSPERVSEERRFDNSSSTLTESLSMNRSVLRAATSLFLLFGVLSSSAWSHYLWVVLDKKSGEHGTVNVYYEGGPAPGDGQYLDRFIRSGKTWIRTLAAGRPAELKMQEAKSPGKRWLSASLTSDGPRSIDSYGKFGVYRYGKTDVLLHYYARHFDVSSLDELMKLGRAEQLHLDIVPQLIDDGLGFQVLWKGKPVAGRPVAVRGPGGFNANLTTDEKGHVHFELKGQGRYTLRTSVEQKETGTDDGEEFQLVRHHGTALINLPVHKK
tara:strand:+ start:50097 stop:50906 length:810 start_codon:yes stop_codon:yes gene_type:complete